MARWLKSKAIDLLQMAFLKSMDVESLAQIEKVLNDGHWIIGKNILSYLDPESLVNVGFASKTANKFVLSYLEKALEETYRKNILDLDTTKLTMSKERREFDEEKWANFFARIKNGSIRQMSMIMPLMKNTDRTIETFNRFRPEANLSYYILCNDDASDVQKLKTWKAFSSLIDDSCWCRNLTVLTWNAMMWLVLTSRNEHVVRFFTEKLSKYDPLGFIRHARDFNHNVSMSDMKNSLIVGLKLFFSTAVLAVPFLN